jgi:hypothetical protein
VLASHARPPADPDYPLSLSSGSLITAGCSREPHFDALHSCLPEDAVCTTCRG